MALIIVESPTKARTFNRILKGQDFYVFATMGHIRDLPANKMAIDFEHEFKPDYQVIKTKKKVVDQMKKLAEENKEIILATDPDREGEAISYHVAYLLGLITEKWPKITAKKGIVLKRIVFHEITSNALKEALEHPESLRINLVQAQQARRILDRIVGYELSPLLWKKMGKNWLSAGRVQTVALRLVVEREKEIRAFKIEDYYQIFGNFKNTEAVRAKLAKKDGVSYEQKFTVPLFTGEYTYTKTTIGEDNFESIQQDIQSDVFQVADVKEDVVKKYPPPPFTTSLIQQEAFQKHGLSSKMTMRLAQDLYERGLITYHRTDSFNLSANFVFPVKDYITNRYGAEYALEKPRGFRTKSKMAQEAHEAIRPTKLVNTPEEINKNDKLTTNHKKIYKLIFERAVATQMKEAEIKQMKIKILGKKGYEFEAEMQKVLFDGFLKVLNPEYAEKHQTLLPYKQGDSVNLESLESVKSQTKPPPRFNEASIIKLLEEKGIGRPSTYATIISLIQEKNYIEKQTRYFVPTKLGEAISDYLSAAFPSIFDLNFTAGMEDNLDEIAEGKKELVGVLSDFNKPFQASIQDKKKDTSTIDVEETVDEKCPKCGGNLAVRFSKFGKFLACSKYPECKFTKPFLFVVKNKLCPECGGRIASRFTKTRKKFYGCERWPECKYMAWSLAAIKPKTEPVSPVVTTATKT